MPGAVEGKGLKNGDAAMSESALPDPVLPLRLMLLGEWHLPMIACPAEVVDEAEQTLKRLESTGVMLTPEGLREKAEMLGRLWVWKYCDQCARPREGPSDDPGHAAHLATVGDGRYAAGRAARGAGDRGWVKGRSAVATTPASEITSLALWAWKAAWEEG